MTTDKRRFVHPFADRVEPYEVTFCERSPFNPDEGPSGLSVDVKRVGSWALADGKPVFTPDPDRDPRQVLDEYLAGLFAPGTYEVTEGRLRTPSHSWVVLDEHGKRVRMRP